MAQRSESKAGASPPKPKSAAFNRAITPAEQRRRFEETARELGCDDGQALDAAFGKIVPPKAPQAPDIRPLPGKKGGG